MTTKTRVATAPTTAWRNRITGSGEEAPGQRPSCGRRLHGDTGYYRHREPCAAFLAAKPDLGRRPGRVDGKGYRREWYEDVVGDLLRMVSLRAGTLTQVIGLLDAQRAEPDRLSLARIERERDGALARYRRNRDGQALEASMARLDREEQEASRLRAPTGVPAQRAVAWLGRLGDGGALYATLTGPSGERSQRRSSSRSKRRASARCACGSPLTRSLTASGMCCRSAC